jgi:DNA-binding transcriptional MerR regulator
MQFQTKQVLEISGVPKDTLRHWKKLLPPLAHKDGRSQMYTISELLGICLFAKLCIEVGLPVSKLSAQAKSLFQELSESAARNELPTALCVAKDEVSFMWKKDTTTMDTYVFVAVRPILDSIVASIQREPSTEPIQLTFSFI